MREEPPRAGGEGHDGVVRERPDALRAVLREVADVVRAELPDVKIYSNSRMD